VLPLALLVLADRTWHIFNTLSTHYNLKKSQNT